MGVGWEAQAALHLLAKLYDWLAYFYCGKSPVPMMDVVSHDDAHERMLF